MDFHRARCSGWRRVVAAVGFSGSLVFILLACRQTLQAQTAKQAAETTASTHVTRDVRSHNFLVHTDLSAQEAKDLVERLETMLRLVSAYWGRPLQGVIECYVIRDLAQFRAAGTNPIGLDGIRTAEGMTLMRTVTDGKHYLAKSVVYADARPEVVQHEAVHAYCHHTFGRTGPVWYAEGMAEMGHYWKEGDAAVRVDPREIEFLRQSQPKSLAQTLSLKQITGDSWQNYAARWALCHFLVHNPNYATKFLALGRGILTGNDVSFEQTFGDVSRQLWFEYQLFLQHIGSGYRVDLCAWDWNKKGAYLRPGQALSAAVMAGRGWQPAGLSVGTGMQYEYVATGNWRITRKSKPVDANGDSQGHGRLVGVLLKNYQLSAEFEIGAQGRLELVTGGDLYLRCQSDWNELADDSGRVAVQFKLLGRGVLPYNAKTVVAGEKVAKHLTRK
jgi:hypothetical protein